MVWIEFQIDWSRAEFRYLGKRFRLVLARPEPGHLGQIIEQVKGRWQVERIEEAQNGE